MDTECASIGQRVNLEAGMPPQCYTHTDGEANPCWTCHAAPTTPNALMDWPLQEEYAFREAVLTNHYRHPK